LWGGKGFGDYDDGEKGGLTGKEFTTVRVGRRGAGSDKPPSNPNKGREMEKKGC